MENQSVQAEAGTGMGWLNAVGKAPIPAETQAVHDWVKPFERFRSAPKRTPPSCGWPNHTSRRRMARDI
jgi:hypothetical protein